MVRSAESQVFRIRYTDAGKGQLERMIGLTYAGWAGGWGVFAHEGGGNTAFAGNSIYVSASHDSAASNRYLRCNACVSRTCLASLVPS